MPEVRVYNSTLRNASDDGGTVSPSELRRETRADIELGGFRVRGYTVADSSRA